MSTTTNARKPLVLPKGVKNTVEGSTLVRSGKGKQVHVLPAGSTRTLCGIESTKWSETVAVDGTTTNCPVCAEALKAEAKKAQQQATG